MNEREIQHKIVLPYLEKIGYTKDDIELEKSIEVGSKGHLFPDIVAYLEKDTIAFVLDTKKPNVSLSNYKAQIISYGLLLQASLSVLCDGYQSIIYDTKSKQIIYEGKIDGIKKYLSKSILTKKRRTINVLTEEEKKNAQETLMSFQKEEKFVEMLQKCEDIIRDGDGKVGEEAFAELSKILFLKIFAEKESINNFGTQSMSALMLLFAEAKRKYPDLFEDQESILLSDNTQKLLIKEIRKYSFIDTDIDIKGKAFEIFIGNTLTGKLGQFFTPRTVVSFMVGFMPPIYKVENYAPKILDPSCGSGGFLIEILKKLIVSIESKESGADIKKLKNKLVKEQIYGVDTSPPLVRTCKMNMVLHGDGQGGIHRNNALNLTFTEHREFFEYFDLIYTNPPFGNTDTDQTILKNFELGSKNKKQESFELENKDKKREEVDREVLFIELYKRLLKEGGGVAVVLPNVILNGKQKKTRDYIRKHFIIIAVIGLPDRTFKSSNANSHTSIIFLRRKKEGEEQSDVFMAVSNEIGYERKTKKALPISKNDFPVILETYKNYLLTKSGNIKSIERLENKCWIVSSNKLEDRLDANYYYAKYMIDVENGQELKEICEISKEKLHSGTEEYKYVQFSDVSESWGAIVSYTAKGTKNELPSRAQMIIKENNILCARLFDSEKNIVIVPKEYDGQIASTGFAVLKSKIPYQVLYYLMRLESTREQIRYFCSGTILPTCHNDCFYKIRVPKIDKEKQKIIIDSVNQIEIEKNKIKERISQLPIL